MNIKGYIFDYGGTLDTNGCHWGKMLWKGYCRHDVGVTESQFRDAYVYGERTLGRTPIIQTDYTFRKTLAIKLRIEFEYLQEKGLIDGGYFNMASKQSAILNDLYEQVLGNTAAAKEVLMKLKKTYSMVLVSNFYGNLNVVLEEVGLDGIFDKVVESAVVDVRKPDPAIFQLGVDAMGLQPDEIVAVGDSYEKDIVPAHKVGLHTVWLKGEQWDDIEHDESLPDRVITSLNQLLE